MKIDVLKLAQETLIPNEQKREKKQLYEDFLKALEQNYGTTFLSLVFKVGCEKEALKIAEKYGVKKFFEYTAGNIMVVGVTRYHVLAELILYPEDADKITLDAWLDAMLQHEKIFTGKQNQEIAAEIMGIELIRDNRKIIQRQLKIADQILQSIDQSGDDWFETFMKKYPNNAILPDAREILEQAFEKYLDGVFNLWDPAYGLSKWIERALGYNLGSLWVAYECWHAAPDEEIEALTRAKEEGMSFFLQADGDESILWSILAGILLKDASVFHIDMKEWLIGMREHLGCFDLEAGTPDHEEFLNALQLVETQPDKVLELFNQISEVTRNL